MLLLKVKNLWFRYQESDWVLRDITFEAHEGQLIVIAGESGSGKSTLARILSGFIPFFYPGEVKGKVEIYGVNPIKLGADKLVGLIGFLGQNPSLYTVSTNVKEELIYPMEIKGIDVEGIEKRLGEVVNFFSLRKLVDKSLLEISSGELQRTALASILAFDPKVFILDEPLARLDPPSARKISRFLSELTESGKIVIVFEHHLDEILPLSDKVIVLENGRKIFEGSPREAVRYLINIDIPEISEAFLESNPDSKEIPLTVEEAVKKCEQSDV